MLKLSEWRKDHYYYFSGKASELARNHSFAGIAIIWIFKTVNGVHFGLPKKLFYPIIFFALSILIDLFQYVWGTIIWGYFTRKEEKKIERKIKELKSKNVISNIEQDPDIDAPRWYNWPTNTFFTLKIILVVIGYFFLFQFLIEFVKAY
ncbi:MAG: hypothetical protein MUO31_14945 [Thermodesulfovibrionales bacterium]|nr:hypothetical protein [Thermodesulfovibrionales bacterium]